MSLFSSPTGRVDQWKATFYRMLRRHPIPATACYLSATMLLAWKLGLL